MKIKRSILLAIASVSFVSAIAGCGLFRPINNAKVLSLDSNDTREVSFARQVEQARLNYHNALTSLGQFYRKTGVLQQFKWTQKEVKNLERTQSWHFSIANNALQGITPETIPADADENYRVEQVITWRQKYLLSLRDLANYYTEIKAGKKRKIVNLTLLGFRDEETYKYILSIELPPFNLRPSKVIAKADIMYTRALQLYKQGSAIPAVADYKKQREALKLFKKMIELYPQSTNIANAAFYIGEIYKEYFHEHYLAVLWYKRALTWNPNIAQPIRYQIAVQLDFNLGKKSEALKYYRDALKHEPYYPGNVRYCKQRIRELLRILGTREMQQRREAAKKK